MDRDEEFRDLFADECAQVTRTVYLIVQDEGRAEEITQDAFVQLFRNWRKVVNYDRPGAWVRQVAIRRAINAVNRERRLSAALQRWRPVPDPVVATGPDMSPEVLAAMGRLAPKQRAALVLFYFEDRPVDEVAELLNCAPSTAGVHLHRARERMAQLLTEEVSSHVG